MENQQAPRNHYQSEDLQVPINQSRKNSKQSLTLIEFNRFQLFMLILISFTIGVCTILPQIEMYNFYSTNFSVDDQEYTRLKTFATWSFCLKPVIAAILDSSVFCSSCKCCSGRNVIRRLQIALIIASSVASISWIIIALFGADSQGLTVGMRVSCSLSVCTLSLVNELLIVLSSQTDQQNWSVQRAALNLSMLNIVMEITSCPIQVLGSFFEHSLTSKQVFLITASLYSPLLIISIIYFVKYLNKKQPIQSVVQSQDEENSQINQIDLMSTTQKTCKQKFKLIFGTYFFKYYFLLTLLFLFSARFTPGTTDMVMYYLTDYLDYSITNYGYYSSAYFLGTAICAVFYYISTKYKCKWRKYKFQNIFIFAVLLKCLTLSTKLLIQFIGDVNKLIIYGIVSLICAIAGQFGTILLMEWAINYCPRNLESTFYSMMIFALNLGDQIARIIQSNVFEHNQDQINYSNMWKFMLISAGFSLLPLIMYICICTRPDQMQKEAKRKFQEIKDEERRRYMQLSQQRTE